MTTFRFLDLHPELRNRIYECYYEDATPSSVVDLNKMEVPRPQYNLARVSQQLRFESLGYYKQACDDFWQRHTFTCTVTNGIPRDIVRSGFRKRLAALPRLKIMEARLGSSTMYSLTFFKCTGKKGTMCLFFNDTMRACNLHLNVFDNMVHLRNMADDWEEQEAQRAAQHDAQVARDTRDETARGMMGNR